MDDLMDGRDFVEHGYAFDLNRRWAHPLGLEVVLTRTIGGLRFAGFRDLRTVPGGAFYGETLPKDALPKAVIIHAERMKRAAARRQFLGALVEPVAGEPLALTQVAGLANPERDWAEVLTACGRYAVALVENLGLPEAAASEAAELAVSEIVSALLTTAAVDERGRIGFGPAPKATAPDIHRVQALIAEIDDLQAEHGQLYPDKLQELEQIRAAVAAKPDRAGQHAEKLEAIYGLAQPGMRFFQGDPAAVDAFNARRPALTAFIRSTLDARSDLVRLLDGAIGPEQVREPVAALVELDTEIAPLAEHVAAERADIERRARDLAVAEDKLARMQRAAAGLRARTEAA